MLISRKHKFIFIHIYKTAGTSITQALLPYITTKWKRYANNKLKRIGITYFDPQPYFKHIKTVELIEIIGEKKFSRYFSFAFVRNPWDLQVSLYKYILMTVQDPRQMW